MGMRCEGSARFCRARGVAEYRDPSLFPTSTDIQRRGNTLKRIRNAESSRQAPSGCSTSPPGIPHSSFRICSPPPSSPVLPPHVVAVPIHTPEISDSALNAHFLVSGSYLGLPLRCASTT